MSLKVNQFGESRKILARMSQNFEDKIFHEYQLKYPKPLNYFDVFSLEAHFLLQFIDIYYRILFFILIILLT